MTSIGAGATTTSRAPASAPIASQLVRGALGFGLIAAAIALTPSLGAGAFLLVLPGMVALRGCPTCWVVGLIEAVSAGRLRRTCAGGGCTLQPPTPPSLEPRSAPSHVGD
jgi:hypothetical protein